MDLLDLFTFTTLVSPRTRGYSCHSVLVPIQPLNSTYPCDAELAGAAVNVFFRQLVEAYKYISTRLHQFQYFPGTFLLLDLVLLFFTW